jgi:hypothetical protein
LAVGLYFFIAGLVMIDDPLAYGRTPNSDVISGKKNVYQPSIFHQLDCLKYLHNLYMHLRNQNDNISIVTPEELPQIENCVDYLRQGAMCAGDMTLEIQETEESTKHSAMHTCRDWSQISEWQDSHSAGVVANDLE